VFEQAPLAGVGVGVGLEIGGGAGVAIGAGVGVAVGAGVGVAVELVPGVADGEADGVGEGSVLTPSQDDDSLDGIELVALKFVAGVHACRRTIIGRIETLARR
jgi:hypothetical protein